MPPWGAGQQQPELVLPRGGPHLYPEAYRASQMSFMWLFSSFFTMLVPTTCRWERSLAVRSKMASRA